MMNESTFRVLRFHFMAGAGLLGKAKFEFASYVTRSMEKHVHEIIEITLQSWIVIACVVGATIPIDFSPTHSLYAWVGCGWLLFFLELLLLWRSNAICARLIFGGHRLRLFARRAVGAAASKAHAHDAAALHANGGGGSGTDTGGSSDGGSASSSPSDGNGAANGDATPLAESSTCTINGPGAGLAAAPHAPLQHAISSFHAAESFRDAYGQGTAPRRSFGELAEVRMRELSAAVQTAKTPSLMTQLMSDMQAMRERAKRGEGAASEHCKVLLCETTDDGEHEEEEEEGFLAAFSAAAYNRPGGLELVLMPQMIQLLLILQCMLQALIITLLGRDALILFSDGADGEVEPSAKPDLDGTLRGIGLIVAMGLPTILMSTFLTPLVVKNYGLAYATAHRQPDVLQGACARPTRPHTRREAPLCSRRCA